MLDTVGDTGVDALVAVNAPSFVSRNPLPPPLRPWDGLGVGAVEQDRKRNERDCPSSKPSR